MTGPGKVNEAVLKRRQAIARAKDAVVALCHGRDVYTIDVTGGARHHIRSAAIVESYVRYALYTLDVADIRSIGGGRIEIYAEAPGDPDTGDEVEDAYGQVIGVDPDHHTGWTMIVQIWRVGPEVFVRVLHYGPGGGGGGWRG